ncbi:hypothetical protein DFH06DRAFT_1140708 [Mycena polygramma]|nr:hypothetical protein DFH06DRAFT_1140708 [Mycena polygramma]
MTSFNCVLSFLKGAPESGSVTCESVRDVRKKAEWSTFRIDPRQVDTTLIVSEVENAVRTGFATVHIDELIIEAAVRASRINPNYIWIASHVEVGKMQKSLPASFVDTMRGFKCNPNAPVLSSEVVAVIENHRHELDDAIVHMRDYDHCYFMIRDLQDRVLARCGPAIIERIQHAFMRMAISIHMDDIPSVLSTYDLLSTRQITLDSLMSLDAGTASLSRTTIYTTSFAYVSTASVYDAIAKCVNVARDGGRVSVCAKSIPCNGRNGACYHPNRDIGLWAMLRLMESALSLSRRFGDKRVDLVNISVEPWHCDIQGLLEFHTMHQHELSEQKSMTFTLFIPDLFMARVDRDEKWSLFCPTNVPSLLSTTGRQFEDAYLNYEASPVARTVVDAREVWHLLLRALVITGGPSVLFKDTVDGKSGIQPGVLSGHTDLRTGVIDTFGLDVTLTPRHQASITLPLLVSSASTFDFARLQQLTRETVVIANRVLDSAAAHRIDVEDPAIQYRPIAIGMDGLADVFAALRIPFDSPEAVELNVRIAEAMYYAALDASCRLAEEYGAYAAFPDSPMCGGVLHCDMWNEMILDGELDWTTLRSRIRRHGIRNALLIAVPPGSSSDTYSGYTRAADPSMSNVNEEIVCPWLVEELVGLGVWTDAMRESVVNAKGSIQDVDGIPQDVKDVYKTAWEIDPECMIRMAAARAPYGELVFSAWTRGLKSGVFKIHLRHSNVTKDSSSFDTDREMSFDDLVLSSGTSS